MTKKKSVLPRDAGSWSEGRSIEKNKFKRGLRKLLGVIDMFTLLTVIIVSQLHIHVKTSNNTLFAFYYMPILHSIKLLKITSKIRYQGSMT